MTKRWVLSILVASAIAASPSAQERKPVAPADYGKWETLGASVLSRDGRWLAVPMTRVDGTAELCLHRGVQPGSPAGADAVFAPGFTLVDFVNRVRGLLGLTRLDGPGEA